MKKIKLRKIYFVVLIIILIALFFIIDVITNKPFDAVCKQRDTIDNKELIATEKNKDGTTMVYSVSEENDGNDKAYFVDMVEKSLIGYKWLGGGGHVNRDTIKETKDFVFSVQLLNEKNNIKPTIFGIVRGSNIKRFKITTADGEVKPTILDDKDENEKFYSVSISQNAANKSLFYFYIICNGRLMKRMIYDEEISELQKGQPIYIYEELLEQ